MSVLYPDPDVGPFGADAVSRDFIVRGKWSLDGAATLAEAARFARRFAHELQSLHEAGYVLREPIRDDYGFYYHPDGE